METLLAQKRAYQRQLKNLQQSVAYNRHQQREYRIELLFYHIQVMRLKGK